MGLQMTFSIRVSETTGVAVTNIKGDTEGDITLFTYDNETETAGTYIMSYVEFIRLNPGMEQ